jgi:hypothetical protein
MRHSALALIISLAVLVGVPAEASAFKYTHKITATGTLTDNWTISDSEDCGPVGSGSVSLDFSTIGTKRIRPLIDKVAARRNSKKAGSWVLAVPGGGGFTHMGSLKGKGTITTVDNSIYRPLTDLPCGTPDKSKCGTHNLKDVFVTISGYDLKNTYGNVNVGGGDFRYISDCQHGALTNWSSPPGMKLGVDDYGDMLFKMPSVSAFKSKKTITLTQSDHKFKSFPAGPLDHVSFTDDVTRKITVTITKL